MSRVNIIYFSGTGGTRMCAQELAKLLTSSGLQVTTLEASKRTEVVLPACDKLVVMYPVYFMNAPVPLEDFISALERTNGQYAAIVSVSAGGEYAPNLACRMRISSLLTDKGYNVIYENMLVMPANCLKKLDDSASACLLKVLPQKVAKIAADIGSGIVRRRNSDFPSHLATELGRAPRSMSRMFAKLFSCTTSCTACGLCVRACPCGNIFLENDKVSWGNNCAACLRCVYQCPEQAIKMKYGSSSFLIGSGYNLEQFVKLAQTINWQDIEKIALLHTAKGVKKYLLDTD